jgi:hypothetical protein
MILMMFVNGQALEACFGLEIKCVSFLGVIWDFLTDVLQHLQGIRGRSLTFHGR